MYIPIEEIWEQFPNKYKAVVLASQEVRRVVDEIEQGRLEIHESPYIYALRRVVDNEVKCNEGTEQS